MSEQTPDASSRLEQIRERWEKASPGPWEACVYESGHSEHELNCSVITERLGDPIADMRDLDRVHGDEPNENGRNDAYAIASAPEDVAWLLGEVERLQMKGIEDCRVLHGYLNDRDIEVARRDKVLEEVRALAAHWVMLSRQAMDQDVREWASAAGHRVLGVLNRAALDTSEAPGEQP